jgi:hypothetical protein
MFVRNDYLWEISYCLFDILFPLMKVNIIFNPGKDNNYIFGKNDHHLASMI